MNWTKQSKGFWRSDCGRFDIIECPGEAVNWEYYRAFDWDLGKTYTGGSLKNAQAWCLLAAVKRV